MCDIWICQLQAPSHRQTAQGACKKIVGSFRCKRKGRFGYCLCKNGEIVIYKTPKPAQEVDFFFPAETTVLTGHTRWTTQGNAKDNYNNHPFPGKTADGRFALSHNGILYNDKELAYEYDLPKTKIKTDTYVAVQLLERQNRLNADTISEMCETVCGNFVFTILDDKNTLYIAKGDNPLCLIHFKELGLYVYSSTTDIMREALDGFFLAKEAVEIIPVDDGEMIAIDKTGNLTRRRFEPSDDWDEYSIFGRRLFDYDDDWLSDIYDISEYDLELLRDYGYCDEEIEMICQDSSLLRMCIEEARMYMGVYE